MIYTLMTHNSISLRSKDNLLIREEPDSYLVMLLRVKIQYFELVIYKR